MADLGSSSASEPIINILLVGRTGHGKSATGNTLLGHRMFDKYDDVMRCKMFRAAITTGPIINVIDTPGIGRPNVSAEYVSNEIIKCLTMAEEGIHAVLFVLSVKYGIEQEEIESTLNTLQLIFGNKILDYFIVVFTGVDQFEEKKEMDDFLRDYGPGVLTRILRLCGGRKVLFNNKTEDKGKKAVQINQLLAHVADIKKQNYGLPYTDKLRRKIKELDDHCMEQELDIKAKNLVDIAVMKENLQMEHERTMNKIMMAHIVKSALKQNAESQRREVQQLKDTLKLQETETMKVVEQMVENARKNDTNTNKIAMFSLVHRLERINKETMKMMESMVENALKMSEATHEKEMHQLKNTLQLNDSQSMNMMAQMTAATHEREMHQLAQKPFPLPQLVPECNIM